MKKFLMLTAILCTAALTAGDTVLNTWNFAKQGPSLYRIKAITTKSSVVNGTYKLEVVKNIDQKKNSANIQLWCSSKGLKGGVKYRVDFTIKANKDASAPCFVMMTHKPWTSVVNKTVKLTANKAEHVAIAFSLKEDSKDIYRTPCFCLGMAEPGTVFEISDVKLVEVK